MRILILLFFACHCFGQSIDETTILVRRKEKASRKDANAFHAKHGKSKDFKHLRWSAVKIVDGQKSIDAYKASPLFDRVELQKKYTPRAYPNDPEYAWWREVVQAPQAWDRFTTNRSAIVAVLDTGIDFNHPDLAGNIWTAPTGEHGYSCTNGVVVAGGSEDGYVFGSHGTHVAGIIGAVGNNGLGVAGLNWSVKLLSIRIFAPGLPATTSDAVNGIEKMVDLKLAGHNIRVSCNAWGFEGHDEALQDAFDLAERVGIINVCACPSGNADLIEDSPSGFQGAGIISVMASDQLDRMWVSSGWGATNVDIAAPGDLIISTVSGGGYRTQSGTSMSCAFVAGEAAALCDINPELTVTQCRDIILSSVDVRSGITNSSGGGRMNFFKAVTDQRLTPKPPVVLVAPKLTVTQSGDLVQLWWTDDSTGEDRFVVERRLKERGKWGAFKIMSIVPDDNVGFTFAGQPGTQCEFRVKACKDSACSPYSNTASIRIR